MKTAVEWMEEEINQIDAVLTKGLVLNLLIKAKEIERQQKIKGQIEILYSIGNRGENAPFYGILKTTLLDLQGQLKNQEQ